MLYLKNDVIILTVIFQNYIDACIPAYGIIPLFHIVHQATHKKAGLKHTGVQLII